MMKWLKKLCSAFDFYKELEEGHQIYYIKNWVKNDYGDVVVTICGLSSGTTIEKPIPSVFRNKAIFHCLSEDDQEKIKIYMDGYGSLSIESVDYENNGKVYNLVTHEAVSIVVSKDELFAKHLDTLDKASLLLLLRDG